MKLFLCLVSVTASDAFWTQLGGDIDGEAAGDSSGWSTSLSSDGSRVAIGARYNDGAGDRAGHVRVYEISAGTSTWTQLGADIDGEAAHDYSGRSPYLQPCRRLDLEAGAVTKTSDLHVIPLDARVR